MAVSKAIWDIAGDDGWHKRSGAKTFEALAKSLVEHGYTKDEALEFLHTTYATVAEEFGG